jgi:hypothetical protein
MKYLRALYTKTDRDHTPKGAGENIFSIDYQKRKPPVK